MLERSDLKVTDGINDGSNLVITVDILARAIQNGLSRPRRRLSFDEAKMTAEHILNFFGFEDRTIDNMLEPEDRDTFYMLEDLGLLMTEREETTLWDGREWRIHYWILNRERIYEVANSKKEEKEVKEELGDIYSELPDDIWMRAT